ncbi:hypothetical protein CDAR_105421 [Caerostris darwini]|uniref:Uncharacterized protein n=1 Tax=Caerostris darwini TaxID=1538125 RepID=A0AAV4MXK8_9ARAC|nr:hypothetical protein CDAR_105421 [Caerostris darwini]
MFPATDPFPLLGFKETLSLSQNWISEFSGWGNGKRNLLRYMNGIGEMGRRRRFLLQTLKEVDVYLREIAIDDDSDWNVACYLGKKRSERSGIVVTWQ